MCPKCRCWWNVAIFWSDESSWMSDFVGFWQCTVWLPLLGLVNPSHAQGPGHAGYPADPAAPQAPPTAFCWGQPFSLWTCAYFLNNFWGLHFYKSSCIGCVSVCARFCPLFRVFPPLLSLRPWSESHLSMKHPAKRRRSEGNDGKWLLSNLHLLFFMCFLQTENTGRFKLCQAVPRFWWFRSPWWWPSRSGWAKHPPGALGRDISAFSRSQRTANASWFPRCLCAAHDKTLWICQNVILKLNTRLFFGHGLQVWGMFCQW